MPRPINLMLAVLLSVSAISFAQQPSDLSKPAPDAQPAATGNSNSTPAPAINREVAAPVSAPIEDPEWAGTVYQLVSGKLTPIEKQHTRGLAKMKGFGYGGSEYSSVVEGEKSPIRTPSSPVFVAKWPYQDIDPSTLIMVRKLIIEKGTRKIVNRKGGAIFNRGSKAVEDTSVELAFSKYGTSSLSFTPTAPLAPGEYEVTIPAAAKTVFLFGID